MNTVQQVYSLFWNSVKATSILCTPRRVAILYAKNSEAKKTYGVIETYPYGHSPEELVKRYAVPGKPCHVFIVYPEGRYHYQEYSKESKIM